MIISAQSVLHQLIRQDNLVKLWQIKNQRQLKYHVNKTIFS